jgi:hypothetical protein
MVPERITQLLTAYVDGELSARKKRAVQRLLRKSPEARALLAKLQEDSSVVRLLPRVRTDRDFASQVLRTIQDRKLNVPRRAAAVAVPATRAPFPAWVGYAAAAAVLFVVFSGSYLFFANVNNPRTSPVANKKQPTTPESPSVNVAHNTPETIQAPRPPDEDRRPTPEVKKTPEQPKEPVKTPEPIRIADKDKGKTTPEKPKTPETPREPDVLTRPAPEKKFEVFKEVTNTRDTLSLGLWDLEKEQSRKKVRDEFEKEAAHRIELFLKSSPKSLEQIESAFKAQGVKLLVDQFAQTRMKAKTATHYVLFVEDVTPEEMTKILEAIGIEDKKAEAAKKGSGQFGQMFVLGMTNEDHEELRKLLGADPVKFGPPPKGPLGVDIRKPVSSKTASEVSDALSGKGVPRPGSGKPAAVPLTRQAIVVSYNPIRPPKSSKEVQQFLDSRAPRRPGTLQILLVLRANNG